MKSAAKQQNKTQKHASNRPCFVKTAAGILVLCLVATLAGSSSFARTGSAADTLTSASTEPTTLAAIQTATDLPNLPEEKVSNPWSRESILITDIYARGEGISESELSENPVTKEDFALYYEYMKGNNIYEISIPVSNARLRAGGDFKSIEQAADFCAKDLGMVMTAVYPELLHCNSYSYDVSYNSSRIRIVVSDKTSQIQHNSYVNYYNLACERARGIVAAVSQTVPDTASDMEMATALIYALADICVYDDSVGILGCSAYGALVDGCASCTGYTAAYVMLLKTAGIDCVSLKSVPHAWVALRLDGEICWADPTLFDNRDTTTYDREYKPGTDMEDYEKSNFTPIQIETEKIYKYWKFKNDAVQ